MTVFDENLTPVLRSNVDFSALTSQPTPEEFFVLSRVNGQLTIAQLCAVTGLGREKTLLALEKLSNVGLLNLSGSDTHASPEPPATSAQPASTAAPQSSRKKTPNYDLLPIAFEDFEFDQQLLAQQVEIDDAIKREILFLYGQLDNVDYYQLLGVDSKAPRKEIRNGYFALSRQFHPDLFFRKLLGDYETRLEKLFQRTVKAYETLSHPKKRAAYDESLATSKSNFGTQNQPGSGDESQTNADKKRDIAFTILVSRADAHATNLNWDKACDEYKNALRIKRDRDLALRVARTLLNTGHQNEQAYVFARAALKMDEDCIDALLVLGELYQRNGAPDKAIAHFRRALEIAPTRLDIQRSIDGLSS